MPLKQIYIKAVNYYQRKNHEESMTLTKHTIYCYREF